ncbi:MAG: ATP-binding protein [Candidatus Solibacter sp.]
MKRVCIRVLWLVCLCGGLLSGQRYSFKEFGQDDGLTNLDVYCLLQDRTGFLWVGTESGLFRYDGRTFRAFRQAQGLPAVQILALHQTVSGELWVGTNQGLARLVGDHFETVRSGPGSATVALASDAAGTLYVGTFHGLVVSKTPAQGMAREFHEAASPPGSENRKTVFAIAVETADRVWYSCGQGLCRLDQGAARAISEAGLPADAWQGLLVDREHTLWVRSTMRLFALSRGAAKFVSRDSGLPPASRNPAVFLDRDGELCVPTTRGLARRSGTGWKLVRRSNGLPTAAVNYFLRDSEGSAWIALDGGGLVRWLGYKNAEIWTETEGLNHDVVWSLDRDLDGNLWAATQAGIARFRQDRQAWEPFRHRLLGVGATLSLIKAGDGTWWAGQAPGGVFHFDPRTGQAEQFGAESGLANSLVYSLAVDRKGQVWAGTPDGLFVGQRLNGRLRFHAVPFQPERAHLIYALLADSAGRVWAGSSGGISRLENGRWTLFTQANGLLHDNVTYLTEGPDHALWVGYRNPSGISRLEIQGGEVRARHFGPKDGLQAAKTYFLRFDRRGWLWVGSDQGVDRWDGKSWRHLDKSDGLAVNDCDHNAFYDDPDGSVWIGTAKGLTHFLHPESLGDRAETVPVVLTNVQFGGMSVTADKPLELPYSQRSFAAQFAALTFVDEAGVRFRHRLLGLDATWAETLHAEAYYPGLPPGSFQLEVQASVGGKWFPMTARLPFRVLPPWWLTWWARTGAVLLLLLAARWLMGWRVRNMLRRQAELEKAVEDRTHKLQIEQQRALEEKNIAEREKAIVEKQKVEIEHLLAESRQAARAKTEFLANMSHEIRTPLNGIMGMTEVMLQTPLNEDQAVCLRLVRVSADSLLVVINDILDFSKIEAGKMRLDNVEFELAELPDNTLATIDVLARQRGLEVRHSVAEGVPARLTGDPGRLRQILLNLVGNAVKFTEKGSVEVLVEAQTPPPGKCRLQFQIRDTGIGIEAAKQSLIFEPFLQADGSTSRRYGGTGLGLSICRRLVTMMGGQIWCESRMGAGSTFTFTIEADAVVPAADPAPASDRPVAEPSIPRGLRVLLAEDNMVNRMLAQRLLEQAGALVYCAVDGQAAIDACAAQRFDLILMDVQMPRMDGFEATAEIRRRECSSGAHIPIVALTANAMSGDRELCIRAGMDGFVSKPMKRADLFQAIADCLTPGVPPQAFQDGETTPSSSCK